ncbi:MAG: GNAT family protein [Methanocorpusculum sp.]|nr:GNAT family protein [Methanocorpusculum sp.]
MSDGACGIRRWRLSDAPALAVVLSNRHVLDNLRDGLPFPYTEADAADFISAMLASDPDAVFSFAVTEREAVAGCVGIFRGQNIHFRTAELGYYIGEPFWGRGLATCAVRQACAYVFAHTDILRIFAEPFAENAASCRVLEKAGFVCEGVLRQNAVKNGAVRDMKMYALVREL